MRKEKSMKKMGFIAWMFLIPQSGVLVMFLLTLWDGQPKSFVEPNRMILLGEISLNVMLVILGLFLCIRFVVSSAKKA